MFNPYENIPIYRWPEVTDNLINQHPLSLQEIHEVAIYSWTALWQTKIGSGDAILNIQDIAPPATVIGYFFEKLMAKELERRYPNLWAGGTKSDHKDLHYLNNPYFSIEIKSSGQPGFHIYGNRSFSQEIENPEKAKKNKSGYYITINFFGQNLNLIRFGWIDGSDWKGQAASSGQMAWLRPEVYSYKLVAIRGNYTLDAPVHFLKGVGDSMKEKCNQLGIFTIRDVLNNHEIMKSSLPRVYHFAMDYFSRLGATI